MLFNAHRDLEGLHAAFSASKPSWLNYDEDKLIDVYNNQKAKAYGTRLHAWAKETIDLGIEQPKTDHTLYSYVNDAIGYQMDTEVVLAYSNNFFGTADAISYRNGFLRIHDLKTGKTPVHIEQLEVYAALFCLEYKVDPKKIDMELRIYQNDSIIVHIPDAKNINSIMRKITKFDKLINKFDKGGNSVDKEG